MVILYSSTVVGGNPSGQWRLAREKYNITDYPGIGYIYILLETFHLCNYVHSFFLNLIEFEYYN